MDPGYKLLQHIKTVPNLINEDPSIVTPKNSSFMDLPWSDFSKLLAKQDTKTARRASNASVETTSTSSSTSDKQEFGNWDAMTGFQDAANARQ